MKLQNYDCDPSFAQVKTAQIKISRVFFGSRSVTEIVMLRADTMMTHMSAGRVATQQGTDVALARMRKGDLDALPVVMDEYEGRLLRFLVRLVKDQPVAEDLFQLTWLRVMEKIKSYDPARDFAPWLFTIARHLALDHLRRYQPESLDDPLPSGNHREDLIPHNAPGAMEALLAGERTILLAQAMVELPLIFREVLTLRFEEEMKLEEIAALLKVPLSTVKSRLRRGLDSLRTKLREQLQRIGNE
jgi:RNA polymerase sigma-70 factor, ECF subfamily